MSKKAKKSNVNVVEEAIINNALAMQYDIEADNGGEGVEALKLLSENVRKSASELRSLGKMKECQHYVKRYIHKHHANVIRAVNEAIKNFKRSEDVVENKMYFALAIANATNTSCETRQSTAYDILCEFEKFINAKTDADNVLVQDTINLLKEGVAVALMTTQAQTFNHLRNAEEIEERAKADAELAEQQSADAIADIL